MEISARYSREVFEDALSAVNDKDHPCRHMFDWQLKNHYEPFQLPEPFSGAQAQMRIALVGLNPSVTHDEIIPTLEKDWTFEAYDKFFRSRFDDLHRDHQGKIFVDYRDGRREKVRLWNNIELFANEFLSPAIGRDFRLGQDAVLLETVRYKSKKGWLGSNSRETKRLIEHQTRFTQMLIDENLFSILVPMGNDALAQVINILSFSERLPTTIGGAMGKSYFGRSPSGAQIVVCPIKHLSYPPNRDEKVAVAKQILDAFEKYGA